MSLTEGASVNILQYKTAAKVGVLLVAQLIFEVQGSAGLCLCMDCGT